MIPSLKQKLRLIRSSDEQTKKRWFFILSGISIFCVIGIWIVYINMTLPNANKEVVEKKENKLGSVFETFKQGVGKLFGDAKSTVKNVAGVLEKITSSTNPGNFSSSTLSTSTPTSSLPFMLPVRIATTTSTSTNP